jgi:Zn-dependent protease
MELLGVRLRIHRTFVWVLVLFFLMGAFTTLRHPPEGLDHLPGGARFVLGGLEWLALGLLLFSFVVLHELSHSLVARAHGVHVYDITLLPIGGMARLAEMPEDPATEFQIAVAGPVLNFILAGVTFWVLLATGGAFLGWLLEKVLVINLALGIFNLLPAFPMDGGRLLRACLTTRHGYLVGTRKAARVGRWVALGLGIIGVLTFNLLLIAVAVFVWFSGRREEAVVSARYGRPGLWNLFGFVPRPPRQPPPPPPGQPGVIDVIDVEGHIREAPEPPTHDGAAAAFRRLSQDIEAQIRR